MSDTRTAEDIINARRIIEGPSDTLRAVSPLKYPWAWDMRERMEANEWKPAEVNMTRDSVEYNTLTKGEVTMYDRALAFLSNLDAIQLGNLSDNIAQHVTAPEIKTCLNRQIWEEEVHVVSYSLMVESTSSDPMKIYDMHRHNELLKNKNEFVTRQAYQVGDNFTPEGFVKALMSNLVLEGIYFFSGFLAFYAIARGPQKMLGSSDMIKYIQRDELTHLDLFTHIWHDLKKERPELFTEETMDECRGIIEEAVDYETAWGQHIIEDGVMGLTDDIIRGFIEHRSDVICDQAGLPRLYNTPNTVEWFYKASEVNRSEGNFFESKPIDYQRGGLKWG